MKPEKNRGINSGKNMRGRIQKEIDKIIFSNLKRFLEEYYDKGKTRSDLAESYNKITGKDVDPSYFSQLSGGHSSLGKDVIGTLAKVFGKKEYLFYIPEDVQIKNIALRGRYISVWSKNNQPESFTPEGLPVGGSAVQELSESTNPHVFCWEVGKEMVEDYDDVRVCPGDRLVVDPGGDIRTGQLVWCHSKENCRIRYYFPHEDKIELRPVNPKFPSKFRTKYDEDFQIYPIIKVIRDIG